MKNALSKLPPKDKFGIIADILLDLDRFANDKPQERRSRLAAAIFEIASVVDDACPEKSPTKLLYELAFALDDFDHGASGGALFEKHNGRPGQKSAVWYARANLCIAVLAALGEEDALIKLDPAIDRVARRYMECAGNKKKRDIIELKKKLREWYRDLKERKSFRHPAGSKKQKAALYLKMMLSDQLANLTHFDPDSEIEAATQRAARLSSKIM